jgi:hypothetical protein
MSASWAERSWYESVVPTFLERFLLSVCAAAFLGFVINNGMGLDFHQRLGLGIALVGVAYFLSHTAYKSKPISSAPVQSMPATSATTPTIDHKISPAVPPVVTRSIVTQHSTGSNSPNVSAGDNARIEINGKEE